MIERVKNNPIYAKNGALCKHSKSPAFGKTIEIDSQKVTKAFKWLNDNVASHHQRLILGATALTSQPFIDYNNKKVDEQTRKISCAKTLAKIIVGTTTGFSVRYLCTKLAKNYTCVDEMGKKAAKKSFLAPSVMTKFSKDKRLQYINAIGAIMGVLTCVFTNFLIDAPLTKKLTNIFSAKIDAKQKAKGVNK